MPVLLRQPMLEPIQLNGQLCSRTIEIENVLSQRMLPAKFESRKTPGPQGAPQFLFFICLFVAEAAGIAGEIHGSNVNDIFWRPDKPN